MKRILTKRIMIAAAFICISLLVLTILLYWAINEKTEQATEMKSVRDRCSLQLANDEQENFIKSLQSYEKMAVTDAGLVKKICTKSNIIKFCGGNMVDTSLSLVEPETWLLLTKEGTKSMLVNCITVATVNDGIEYCSEGKSYYDKMLAVYNKYADGEVTDANDARNIIKYRFYSARYYLYGIDHMTPVVESFIDNDGLETVFLDSEVTAGSSAVESIAIGGIYDYKILNDIWEYVQDGSGDPEKLFNLLTTTASFKDKLVFSDIDSMLDHLGDNNDSAMPTELLTIIQQ